MTESRTLHFRRADDGPLGMLYVREPVATSDEEDLAWSGWIDEGWTQGGPVAAGWRELGPAEGDVVLPSGVEVALEIEFARNDLSPLADLPADALTTLAVSGIS